MAMIESPISKHGKSDQRPAPFWMHAVTMLLLISDSAMALLLLTRPGF